MDELNFETVEKQVLLMLSGGRDSFLSACRLIDSGYKVNMITYDNGHMTHTQNAEIVAKRIIARFGHECASFVGVYAIGQDILPLSKKILYTDAAKLGSEYPHLLINQINCLACHTVMYLHSIAYCKANFIGSIAEGAREEQGFFVELAEMKERYEKLCDAHGLKLILPVFDLTSDVDRKKELARWKFEAKTFEPQCWLGCPLFDDLSDDQRGDLAMYYDKEMLPQLDDIIGQLISTKKKYNTNETDCYF